MSLYTFGGFEHGGKDELNIEKGSVTITAGANKDPFQAYYCRFPDASTLAEVTTTANGLSAITTNSDHYLTIGFYIRFDDATPSSDMQFFTVHRDAAASRMHMGLTLKTTGVLQIDPSSGTATTGGVTLASNTWYLIEIELNISDTGSCTVYVDQDQNLSDSSGDFFHSGTESELRWVGSAVGASSRAFDVGSFYCFEDASAFPARLGPFYVLNYGYDEATVTPNVTGDDLAAGQWADANEIPGDDANQATYDSGASSNEGVVETSFSGASRTPGPKGDSRSGFIEGASWVFRYSRDTGLGSAEFYFKYGAGDGSDGTVETSDLSPTTTVKSRIIAETGGNVPDESEYFQYGFRQGGTLDVHLEDAWCNLLCRKRRGYSIGSAFPGGWGKDILS